MQQSINNRQVTPGEIMPDGILERISKNMHWLKPETNVIYSASTCEKLTIKAQKYLREELPCPENCRSRYSRCFRSDLTRSLRYRKERVRSDQKRLGNRLRLLSDIPWLSRRLPLPIETPGSPYSGGLSSSPRRKETNYAATWGVWHKLA